MFLIRISDKRFNNGYKIKFFRSDNITKEIIDFVKKTT